MYTIKKGNLYVKIATLSGKSSYTSDSKKAVRYNTFEEVKKNTCGNERVIKMVLEYV